MVLEVWSLQTWKCKFLSLTQHYWIWNFGIDLCNLCKYILSLPQIHVVCWLLIVNIIKELELGREETLEIWAGFEMLWSKSVTTLLALEAQSILTRPPAVVLTGPGGPIYTDKAPCSCTDHRLRQMRQSAATAWSWIANEHGNDFTRSYLKLPGSLSITQ